MFIVQRISFSSSITLFFRPSVFASSIVNIVFLLVPEPIAPSTPFSFLCWPGELHLSKCPSQKFTMIRKWAQQYWGSITWTSTCKKRETLKTSKERKFRLSLYKVQQCCQSSKYYHLHVDAKTPLLAGNFFQNLPFSLAILHPPSWKFKGKWCGETYQWPCQVL